MSKRVKVNFDPEKILESLHNYKDEIFSANSSIWPLNSLL